jgi:Uma2 family endonuclease
MDEPQPTLTDAEFLDFVADHPDEQYEYANGRPVAMGRPSTMHKRCDVYFDVRTWVGTRDRVPDIAVTCDELSRS